VGPGAHGHVGGTRWWNVKHPAAYASRLATGSSPAHAREELSAGDRQVERLMLELRLDSGFPLAEIGRHARTAVARALGDGLLEPEPFKAGRAVLTLKGRLLADALVRDLT
jgi:oxygen-independent coproporphyrinogen-3 oxidase